MVALCMKYGLEVDKSLAFIGNWQSVRIEFYWHL
jgi:hypothetical protein